MDPGNHLFRRSQGRNSLFSIGSSGYLGTGWDGVAFKNDFWEYTEGDPVGIGEESGNLNKIGYNLFPIWFSRLLNTLTIDSNT